MSRYFDRIHPWFPVLEMSTFVLGVQRRSSVSSALVCDLYAASLIYWHTSPELTRHPPPDIAYSSNLAVAALQEEFLSPRLDTIAAAILHMSSRPVASNTDNVLTSGRAVALSHSLGLNRDPSAWNILDQEKRARVVLWWGVLIHDRW
jgi:hypothetical protein